MALILHLSSSTFMLTYKSHHQKVTGIPSRLQESPFGIDVSGFNPRQVGPVLYIATTLLYIALLLESKTPSKWLQGNVCDNTVIVSSCAIRALGSRDVETWFCGGLDLNAVECRKYGRS